MGHRPIFSPSSHGTKSEVAQMQELLTDIICPYADLYIAGHDHIQAFITAKCPRKTEVPLLITGAASKAYPNSSMFADEKGIWKLSYTTENQLGFSIVELDEKNMSLQLISEREEKVIEVKKK